MEKELEDTIEVLMYRLIRAGRRQRNARSIILKCGDRPCDLDFVKIAQKEAEKEAGEVRDELFNALVLSENREGAIANESFCNNYEIFIQRIWAADRAVEAYSREILETNNPKLEAYLRTNLKESRENLSKIKQETILFLMSSHTM